MLKVRGKPLVAATGYLARMNVTIGNWQKHPQNFGQAKGVMGGRPLHDVRQALAALGAELEKLGTRNSFKVVERMLFAAHSSPPTLTYEQLSKAAEEINARLRDELEDTILLVIDARQRDFFEPSEPLFGALVEKRFPTLIYEIDEAAKCYALDRSTASAFHSIRCLEAGIRALSRCLGISDPTRASERNWGAMLKGLKEEIDRRWPGSSARMTGDGEFFDSAYAALAAMQNPWRNATMHLDQKYTKDEAKHVMDVVMGFMSKLASRMDENGEPRA